MIDSLRLVGFKGFLDETIPMGSVTLLSGLNNSGKSSVIQALRMFCQSFEGDSPLLVGHGTVDELRARRSSPGSSVCIGLTWAGGEQAAYEQLVLTTGRHERPRRAPMACYVGADRYGPKMVLPIERSLGGLPRIGDQGEFVLDFLGRLEFALLPELLHHEKSEGQTLGYEIEGWLHEIAPGVRFQYRLDQKRDAAYAEIDGFRPTNVGFGISYTLPILAALLGMAAGPPHGGWGAEEWGVRWEESKQARGELVMLENPEAHLHPKGQTAMGELIVKTAACGVQVVVESHSDHLMDGIRIAVKKGLIDAKRVKFHFFDKTLPDQCRFSTPQIYPDGKLEFWPEGFFDQTMKNRAVLAARRVPGGP